MPCADDEASEAFFGVVATMTMLAAIIHIIYNKAHEQVNVLCEIDKKEGLLQHVVDDDASNDSCNSAFL